MAAQQFEYRNAVYDAHIKSVQFYVGENQLTYPILSLQNPGYLTLRFDELSARPSNFYVSVEHCNADWSRSNLIGVEFFDGLQDDPIQQFQSSQSTAIPYTHYQYRFPQPGSRLKASGNYLLKVIRGDGQVVITRRFVVVDQQIGVAPDLGQSFNVKQRMKLQAVQFVISPGQFPVNDPARELKIKVLQNFRWDNARPIGRPRFQQPGRLIYTFDAGTDFEGGNEFRMVDIRSLMSTGRGIATIDYAARPPRAFTEIDHPRTANTYLAQRDLNGQFFLNQRDLPNLGATLNSEYVDLTFRLHMDKPLPDHLEPVLWGDLSDWRVQPTYTLKYLEEEKQYAATLRLKQGLYNYQYAVHNRRTGEIDETRLEGSHFETENYYTILVYYRAISDRADRLIGLTHVNYYPEYESPQR